MKIIDFLSDLNRLNIQLWLEEEKLKYNAPKGVMTPEIKKQIKTRKTEISTFLQGAKPLMETSYSPINPVARNENIPLSFAQQRMWFLYEIDQQNPSYNEVFAIRVKGSLNIEILQQSINALIQRHESLRTYFISVVGKPTQIISPKLNFNLNEINIKEQEDTNLKDILSKEVEKTFDLSQIPLFRCTLINEGSDNYILLFIFHHIIIDGWSINIFFQELFTLYQAFLSGLDSPLTPLSIQYADFAVWQRQWLQGEILEKQLNYWQKQLSNSPPLLELPTDYPRKAVPSLKGHSIPFTIDGEITAKIKHLSQKLGVTPFMTLLAGFNVLLYRYTQQQDILIGTPVANRNYKEIEPLIGFFVNTLVVRNYLDEKLSFQEFLLQVRNVVLEGYGNQDVPFEQVVDALEIERSLSYNPLFQVMFALRNSPISSEEQAGLKISPMTVENVNIKFDLSLILEEINTENGSYLEGFFEYNSDLFAPERIKRMVGHFHTLLTGIINNSEETIGKLPLLTEPEKQQLLFDWNQTKKSYPQDKCIHQLFEKQVTKNPDAIAVVSENESLTYQELNQKSNQVAHYLKSLGVQSNQLIGICLERSPLMIIGFLGILKAGAAYVPLDANYPPERLKYMLEDSEVSVLLTETKLEHLVSDYQQCQRIYLDSQWDHINSFSKENPVCEITPENFVYVIYTSGSTGKPKGVLIQHQNLLNLVFWHQNSFNLSEKDRATQLAGIAFDASVWEIWPYLTCGASLYIVPQDIITSPPLLKDFLCDHQITVSFVPTPLAEVMITDEWERDCCLKFLLTGGDKLNHFPADSLPFTVVNNYGPTENTVVSTSQKLTPDLISQKDPPIGRPLDNTHIYILDQCQQPVPIGVTGELYLSGTGLAYGYLNRPDLTKTRFIPNPFSPKQDSRLYKTGDLVRYCHDGQIEFVGRIDDQVKIRGFRIELGEIETVINLYPQIQEAIVIAKQEATGLKRLYAYFISSQPLNTSELRHFMADKLPQYMIPAFFIQLDAFPLTANGKIDRLALPNPDTSTEEKEETAKIPPSTEIERILVNVWQDVLEHKNIGVNDNFFELGGDSILAISIVAKASQSGLQILPKQLFSHQTIAQLASVVEKISKPQIKQELVTGKVQLTPIQQWFFEQNLPEVHHFNQSICLEVPTNIQTDLLKKAFFNLLKHHDALRLRFVKEQDKWQQYNSDDCQSLVFEKVDLSSLSPIEQLTKMTELDKKYQGSLNLEKGSLMAVVFFNLGGTARLLIIVHHLSIDGVSWRILLDDLAQSYQQLVSDETIKLPAKTTSFKDWAEELQNYAQNTEHQSQLKYWLNFDSSQFLPLPVDEKADRSSNIVANAKTVSFTLSEEQTHSLLQDVSKTYNTQINDVLLTALVQVFADWTGYSHLLIDLESHGRENLFESLNLSRTVGWFTSLFPIFLKAENLDSLGDCLKSVKEQLRKISNHGFDYGIAYYLNPNAEIKSVLQSYPKPEISFNYLGQFTRHQLGLVEWKFSQEITSFIHSPLGERSHLIDINAIIIDGKLEMEWQYTETCHQKTTIEKLLNAYKISLEKIIGHCMSSEGDYTPSDFPNAHLTQEDLDDLLLELD